MRLFCLALGLFFLLAPLSAQEPSSSGDVSGEGGRVSGSYVISPLDYLRIALFIADEQQFQTEVRVSQSGTVTVPHLGTVEIAGKSIEEVRDDLYLPYNRDYYVDPHIEVIVLSYSERSVTVMGKVNRQGLVPFPSEQGLTLLEAIALAGGWSADRLADKRNVTITRRGEDGDKFTIEVDARNLTTRDYQLQEGDVINIPERLW